ncbi:MAG: hypothetical protein ACKVJU_11630 [Verrucomicrobiales bacterium]
MRNGGDSIYAASADDGSEIIRGFQISLLGVDPTEISRGTFFGPQDLRVWKKWADTVFEPIILPKFRAIYEATSGMKHRTIAEVDRELSALFSDETCEHSIAAAHVFHGSKSEVKHMPQWIRFEEKLENGETPGHLATLFAIQSALFNVPIFSALISYAYVEWSTIKPVGDATFEEVVSCLKPMIQASQTFALHSI